MEITTRAFKTNASSALLDKNLQTALGRATTAFGSKRKIAVEALENFEALRDYCGAVKAHTLEYLDVYLDQLVEQIEARGGTRPLRRRRCRGHSHRHRNCAEPRRQDRGEV